MFYYSHTIYRYSLYEAFIAIAIAKSGLLERDTTWPCQALPRRVACGRWSGERPGAKCRFCAAAVQRLGRNVCIIAPKKISEILINWTYVHRQIYKNKFDIIRMYTCKFIYTQFLCIYTLYIYIYIDLNIRIFITVNIVGGGSCGG